jgi:acylphosphatase
MATQRFVVKGRVQGVGYRYFALQEASRLGIAGFARNLPDGGVEVVGEGADDALREFAVRLNEGPSFASVASVETSTLASSRGDQGFHIR